MCSCEIKVLIYLKIIKKLKNNPLRTPKSKNSSVLLFGK